MEQLLTYLLKSALILSIFFTIYQLLLRKDTSFQVNRHFLLLGIFTALVLPHIEFTRIVELETTTLPITFSSTFEVNAVSEIQETTFDWWQLFGGLYLLGFVILLLRFLIQFVFLLKFLHSGTTFREGKFHILRTKSLQNPFSFFNYIAINPDHHSEEELQIILKHEKVHASQWHSLDVLLAHLTSVALWFNPISWAYKKSMIQNLEYLADRETVANAIPRKKYQHTLVKISLADQQPALANNFYQSLIKKRIIMLNKKPTKNLSLWKLSTVLPLLLAFMFLLNVKTEAQVIQNTSTSSIVEDELKLSAVINRNTKQESLDRIARIFEKQGVELEYSTIEFSGDHLLTNIGIAFENKAGGQSGTVHFHNPEGIGNVQFLLENDSFSISKLTGSDLQPADILREIGETPLYILDGKEYKTSDLLGKTIWIKGDISGLSRKEAIEKYGSKAKDGVIFIKDAEILKSLKVALKDIDKQDQPVKKTFLSVEKDAKPVVINVDSNPTTEKFSGTVIPDAKEINASHSPSQTVRIFSNDSVQPIFVVENKVMTREEISKLDKEEIEGIHVYKGKEAISEFGEKGKNGVVVISMKGDHEKAIKVVTSPESLSVWSELLYVLDGKIMDKGFDSAQLDPKTIESIKVLKDEKALKKYGEKARNGAIEITTKKE